MAKNKSLKKTNEFHDNEFHDFEFPDEMFNPDESMGELIHGIIDAGKHQQSMAMELTKLVVSQQSSANLSEESIFSIFKRAAKVVTETFPIKELAERIS